ncbi:MAG: toll/interleukin-1 receptor domain-containing protein, partial [Polyangiaceae bacterium]
MANIYVSYRSSERAFVERVANLLTAAGHRIYIDYFVPVGAGLRNHQLEELRDCDVFLVFVSKDTRASDFQNSEMGGARIWSAFVDQKQIIPLLIDDVSAPRPLGDLDCLQVLGRDASLAATAIERAIQARHLLTPRVRLFISHAHRDADLAERFIDIISDELQVPKGELRCTSVRGYELELGTDARNTLRAELGSAVCVIALLTPESMNSDWVLFELGAAWFNANATIPLLAGGLENSRLPAALQGSADGRLDSPATLERVLAQLQRLLGWLPQTAPQGDRRAKLLEYLKVRKPTTDPIVAELKASFAAKHSRIGPKQASIVDRVSRLTSGKPHVRTEDLAQAVSIHDSELHYRLEQLRLLGFFTRVHLGENNGDASYGWTLSDAYR